MAPIALQWPSKSSTDPSANAQGHGLHTLHAHVVAKEAEELLHLGSAQCAGGEQGPKKTQRHASIFGTHSLGRFLMGLV